MLNFSSKDCSPNARNCKQNTHCSPNSPMLAPNSEPRVLENIGSPSKLCLCFIILALNMKHNLFPLISGPRTQCNVHHFCTLHELLVQRCLLTISIDLLFTYSLIGSIRINCLLHAKHWHYFLAVRSLNPCPYPGKCQCAVVNIRI